VIWLKEMDLHKDSADVMTNAAMFFKLPDKALAVQAAERAHEIEPANPERTALLSFTYAMTILGVSQMSNTGIPFAVNLAEEQSPLAQSIIAKLDKSQDAALLGETGALIARDGMMVTKFRGMGPSDLKVDYRALSERYLQRSVDLDPATYSFGLGYIYRSALSMVVPQIRLGCLMRAACSNPARADPCAGRQVNRRPYRDRGSPIRKASWTRV
jgi:hypothetical protein